MLVPFRGWVLFSLLLIVVLFSYYQAFDQLPFPTSGDDQVRLQLAERWAQKVSFEVRRLPGRPVIAVARTVNDDDGILTSQLKKWISRRNVLMANDQWYSGVSYNSGVYREPKSVDEACEPMLNRDMDYIVAAEIANWTTYPEFEATLVGFVEIRDGRTGETVLRYQLSLPEMIEVVSGERDEISTVAATPTSSTKTPALVEVATSNLAAKGQYVPAEPTLTLSSSSVALPVPPTSISAGLMVWILTMLCLPLSAATSLKRMLRRRSNRMNGTLLITWILFSLILAGLLWLRFLTFWAAALAGVLAILIAAVYFGVVCGMLEKNA